MRAMAILFMLFYHYTKTIPGIVHSYLGDMINEYLCQTAMLTFFTISGYGTYMYLDRVKGNRHWSAYVKSRFRKIAPQYYFCLIIVLLTTGTGYWAWNSLKNILIFFLFGNNLFISTNGEINGVTWTIALMMQFYLFAVPMYQSIKKNGGYKTYLFALAISLIFRRVTSLYIFLNHYSEWYYVIYGIRRLPATIDIFVAGMCSAHFRKNMVDFSPSKSALLCGGSAILSFISFMAITYTPDQAYLFGGNIRCLLWQPLLGVLIAIVLFSCASIKINYNRSGGKIIQFIAKNEYGIYLWHMVLIGNLASQSEIYMQILNRSPFFLLICMIVLAIAVGSLSNCFFNKSVLQIHISFGSDSRREM